MSDEKPAVVVFGATGNQGSNVVRHLHAAGWCDIFAVTRNLHDARSQQVRSFSFVAFVSIVAARKQAAAAHVSAVRARRDVCVCVSLARRVNANLH